MLIFNIIFLITITKLVDSFPSQGTCGQPANAPSINGATLNRIINGQSNVPNSWPWMASLRVIFSDGSLSSHFCGGMLIYNNIVLTAAHCLIKYKAASLAVVIGLNNVSTPLKSVPNLVYYVKKTKYHDSFSINNSPLIYDIGLIQLKTNVTFTNNASLICLPPSSTDSSKVLNKKVVLTGWGSTNGFNSLASISPGLLQTKLGVINGNGACTSNGLTYDTNTVYCVLDSVNNSNACFGDSGGPLIFYTNSLWFVYGITSYVAVYGSGVCNPYLPSYYTQVPVYLTWITTWLATDVWINNNNTRCFTSGSLIFFIFINLIIYIIIIFLN